MPTCSEFGPTNRTSGTRMRSLMRVSVLMGPPNSIPTGRLATPGRKGNSPQQRTPSACASHACHGAPIPTDPPECHRSHNGQRRTRAIASRIRRIAWTGPCNCARRLGVERWERNSTCEPRQTPGRSYCGSLTVMSENSYSAAGDAAGPAVDDVRRTWPTSPRRGHHSVDRDADERRGGSSAWPRRRRPTTSISTKHASSSPHSPAS